jgi:hypothetical protein
LPPPEALDEWEVRHDSPDASGSLRSGPGTASHQTPRAGRTNGLEPTAGTDDEGLVSAEGFDPDLFKPERTSNPSRNGRAADEAPVAKGSPNRGRGQPNSSIELPSDELADSEAVDPEQPEQAGWETAARRLKELGIRNYRLESQIEEQTFLFICHFNSPENPRIVRRFEAEADTPLDAVQQVLRQIDEWRSRDVRGGVSGPSADDEQ